MNKYLLLALVFQAAMAGTQTLFAQDKPRYLIRAYWDNDFFNIWARRTDEAYTNGLRFDLFYQQRNISRKFFLNRLIPKAGDSSITVKGWGFGQIMMTPRDLSKTDYQSGDYPYAGALTGVRSIYSYNPEKKYSFQTEIMFGVRGPESYAAQTQIFIHRLIGDQRPMGWNNQLGTRLIINLNFTAEKQIAHYSNVLEVMVGGQASMGTLVNYVSTYATLRIGKMTPYFNGYISQLSSRSNSTSGKNSFQAYMIIRPGIGLTIDNDIVVKETGIPVDAKGAAQSPPRVERWNLNIDYGAVIVYGRIGFSLTQKSMSAMLKGLPRHEVGNFSLYYAIGKI